MRWEGHKESQNVEDRRPEEIAFQHPSLGAMSLFREKDSHAPIALVPEKLNEECAGKIKAMKLKQSFFNATGFTGIIDTMLPDVADALLPKSCGAQIRKFFKEAADQQLIPYVGEPDADGKPIIKAYSPSHRPLTPWER